MAQIINDAAVEKAARTLEIYNQYKAQGPHRIMWQKYYDSLDLLGLANQANPITQVLPAGDYTFFQSPVGSVGGGITRQKTYAETNHDGGQCMMPSGLSFVGYACGLSFMPEIPLQIKQHLDRFASLSMVRMSYNWKMGAIWAWPAPDFHCQSLSVANGLANTFVEFAVNGRTPMTQFPSGGELVFPQLDIIKFVLTLDQAVPMTLDGAVANLDPNGVPIPWGVSGSNMLDPLYGCLCALVMEGGRFEEPSA